MIPTFDYQAVGKGVIQIIPKPESCKLEVIEAIVRSSANLAHLLINTDSRDHEKFKNSNFSGYVHLDNPLGNIVTINDIEGLVLDTHISYKDGKYLFSSSLYLGDTELLFKTAKDYLAKLNLDDPIDDEVQ